MADAHSQIDRIIAELESAERRLKALASRTSDEKWITRNRPERWSIAECVEHLNMTSRAYLPLIRQAVESPAAASIPGRTSAFRRDPAGLMLSAMIGPLHKLGKLRLGRVKTTPEFEPKDAGPKNQEVADFTRLQIDLVRLIRSSERRNLDEIRILSPFGGKIRYNLFSAFIILPRHQHRHIQQAEEVWE